MADQKILGYLVWYSIGSVSVPYNQIAQAGKMAGIDERYVPSIKSQKVHKRGAWEKGTSITKKGRVIKPSQNVVDEYIDQHGVEPIFKVLMRNVKSGGSMLKRQLMLEILTPTSISDVESDGSTISGQEAKKRASKQLSIHPVWLFELDTNAMAMRSTPVDGPATKLNGRLQSVVADIENKISELVNNADDQTIRQGIRTWMTDHSGINARQSGVSGGGAGGVYFLPKSDGIEDEIEAMVDYVQSLAPYTSGVRPTLNVLECYREGSRFAPVTTQGLKDQVVLAFEKRMAGVIEKIKPVSDGKRGGKHAKNTTDAAHLEVMQIKSDLVKHRAAFDDQLETLNIMMELIDARLDTATDIVDALELKPE